MAVLLCLPLLSAHAQELSEDEKFVFVNCGRCHVINPERRMGGIGSTPSFMAIRSWPGWEAKMKAFWSLNPHPAFTQIDGVTDPFPQNRPPPIAPIRLTPDEIERILDYARTLEPANLGGEVRSR